MNFFKRLFAGSDHPVPSESGPSNDTETNLSFHVVLVCDGGNRAAVAEALSAAAEIPLEAAKTGVRLGELPFTFPSLQAAQNCESELRKVGAQTLSGSRPRGGAESVFMVILTEAAPFPEKLANNLVENFLGTPEEALLIARHGGVIDFNLDQGTAKSWADELRGSYGCSVEIVQGQYLGDL